MSNSNGSIYIVELNEINQIQPSGYHMEISKLIKQNNIQQSIPNNMNTSLSNNYFQHPNNMTSIQKDQLKNIFSSKSNNSNNLNLLAANQNKNSNDQNINMGIEMPMESKKRKINPIMLDDKKNGNLQNYGMNYSNTNGLNNLFGNYINDINPMQNNINESNYINQFISGDKHMHENDNCNLCKVLRFDSIQTREVNIKLDLADEFSAGFIWENKINSYYSYIKFIINNKILFYNYLNGKFIKHFVCNNFVYVYYDTNNLIHISSLLNTNVNYYYMFCFSFKINFFPIKLF